MGQDKEMDMEDVLRITKEVAIGRKPARPDDEEMAALRKRLEAERARIEAAGGIMDIPPED